MTKIIALKQTDTMKAEAVAVGATKKAQLYKSPTCQFSEIKTATQLA